MKRTKRATAPRVSEVLSGAVSPDLETLFALIHDVNPTGRDLPAHEQSRRYGEKSRLQSLLVKRFGERLSFEVAEDPRVVTIRHAALGYDACHAVIDELDEEPRSFVQRALDLRDDGPSQPEQSKRRTRGPGRERGAEREHADPLARGRAALEEYDYEAARSAFDAALVASRGGAEAAVALLELLVDHLCEDVAALALAAQLDVAARRDARVRVKFGLRSAPVRMVLAFLRQLSEQEGNVVADDWLRPHAEHPEVRFYRAHCAAVAAQWEQLAVLLPPAGTVPAELSPHRAHLEALLHVVRGDLDRATALLRDIEAEAEFCGEGSRGHILHLASAFAGKVAPSEGAELAMVIAEATVHIDAGRTDRALSVLDRRKLWALHERQHLARAAHCILERPTENAAERMRARVVLGRYLATQTESPELRCEVVMPYPWSNERLEGIAERARARLDEMWKQVSGGWLAG